MSVQALERLSRVLDVTGPPLLDLNAYYSGTQPLTFLSAEAKEALGDRLRSLAVNFPKLAVDSLAERLSVEGFQIDGAYDGPVWQAWLNNEMDEGQHLIHTEELAIRRGFVLVWARPDGSPSISVESALDTAVERDPVTREVTAAAKRWVADNKAHAMLFEPHQITGYMSHASVPTGGVVPPEGWQVSRSIPNPLGVVPVVPFVNRGRLLDVDGVSEMEPVLDLADALNKLTADLMVSSEFFARPRRWVTGLEVEEDDDGNPVNPFGTEARRVWQSESPETRFGEFGATNLAGYSSAVAIITQQIGALTGLPPHYLGLHGDQPASADAIRSSESSLVSKAVARQRTFGKSWAQVAALVSMVSTGRRPAIVKPVWASPETRTPAQAADAAAKLVAAGIVPVEQALDDLGYSPEQVAGMRVMRTPAAMEAAFAGAQAIPRRTTP